MSIQNLVTDVPAILTLEQAAAFLQVSTPTLLRYCKKEMIPHIRWSAAGGKNSVRFTRTQLTGWLAHNQVEPGRFVIVKTVDS